MKLLLDMNISPQLCDVLRDAGWAAVHWSDVGKATAPDEAILDYAKTGGHVVITHDLDYSAILSATKASAPSVVQIRFQDILSQEFIKLLTDALRQFEAELDTGALLVIDASNARARVLPVGSRGA